MVRKAKNIAQAGIEIASAEELAAFVAALDIRWKHRPMAKIAAIFGSDLLVFLDVLAGASLKVPSVHDVFEAALKARMWSEQRAGKTLEEIAAIHKITVEAVEKKCQGVEEALQVRNQRRLFDGD